MLRRYETEKTYRNKLPKIIIENSNITRNGHFVCKEDRKIKNITLFNYNRYIKDYTKNLKCPTSNHYSTDKLKHSIPFKNLQNINLNKNLNFLADFSDFHLFTKTSIFNTNNNNGIFNRNRLLTNTNTETKDHILFQSKFYKPKTDKEILKYFIEGTFLSKPDYLKYLGINEKKIFPRILNQSDFEFYSNYLDNLNKNENLTDYKSKNYELNDFNNQNKLNFALDLKSICFQFEKININDMNKNIDEIEHIIDNNDSIDFSNNNDNTKNIHNLYLPFKYLPLLFLLNYSLFKSFISEILSYDFKNNQFNFTRKENLEEVIKKYSDKCKQKLNDYIENKNSDILKKSILYKNEFHYNNEFFWLIFDDDNVKEIKVFKFKIIFPLIEFQISDYNTKFQRYCNKWLLLELIKENFKSWDKYLLFTLFLNKYLRKSISEILNKKKGFSNFFNKSSSIGPVINDYYYKKNHFDFFITEISLNINHYYFIVPYQASISKKVGENLEKNDSIFLKLNNARKIYKLSEYFGLAGIFNKCIFYNQNKKSFYFSLQFLDDINNDYFLFLQKQKKVFVLSNRDTKNIFRYNGNEFHLDIRENLLCERRVIENVNQEEYKYYKIPEKLYKTIMGDGYNKEKEVVLNLMTHANEILTSNEIDEKSITLSKTKSFKSYKRKNTNTFKNVTTQFIINKNTFLKKKTENIFEIKKLKKDNSPSSLNKKKISSFKNVRIFDQKLK